MSSAANAIVISDDEDKPRTLRQRLESLEDIVGCPYDGDRDSHIMVRIRYVEGRLGVVADEEANIPTRLSTMEVLVEEEGMRVPLGIAPECRSWHVGFVRWYKKERSSLGPSSLKKRTPSTSEENMHLNFLAFNDRNFGSRGLASDDSHYLASIFACRPLSFQDGAFGKWSGTQK